MINRILEGVTAAILMLMVVIAFVAVIFRYVIESSLSWSFEATMALLTYLTFISCYLALRQGAHLKVDYFIKHLPLGPRTAVFALNRLLIFAVGLVMVVWGLRQTWLYREQTTLVMEIPVWVLYVIIPMSGLAMGLDAFWQLVAGLRRAWRGEDPEVKSRGLSFGAGVD